MRELEVLRKKYPQYKDLSDKDIGEKMLAKYPQYQDMVDDNVQSEDKPSLPYRIGKAIAPIGETLGRTFGIGYAQKQTEGLQKQEADLLKRIQQETDPQKKEKYIKMLQKINPDVVSQIPELK